MLSGLTFKIDKYNLSPLTSSAVWVSRNEHRVLQKVKYRSKLQPQKSQDDLFYDFTHIPLSCVFLHPHFVTMFCGLSSQNDITHNTWCQHPPLSVIVFHVYNEYLQGHFFQELFSRSCQHPPSLCHSISCLYWTPPGPFLSRPFFKIMSTSPLSVIVFHAYIENHQCHSFQDLFTSIL